MQARFKGSPSYLVFTLTPLFLLTVNRVWTMNYMQEVLGWFSGKPLFIFKVELL